MSTLAVPLSQAQIDAANRLHSRLSQWMMIDNALSELGQAFPTWTAEASLLKVAAINQLYGTNLYAIVRMAEHVTWVMSSADPKREGPALVERIAALPTSQTQGTQRNHRSFASKLAHFFIDAAMFPIYDSYAVRTVAYHLGKRGKLRNLDHPYQAYVANLTRLREWSGLTWQERELDRYLWLAGQYRTWMGDAKAPINRETRQLFEKPGADADDLHLVVAQD